jgi:hypothetical protein
MRKTIEHLEKLELTEGVFDLVRGDFNATEAEEILNHLVAEKISFHEKRSHSSLIRLGHADEASLKRVVELKETKKRLNELVKEAKSQGKKVRIASDIAVAII